MLIRGHHYEDLAGKQPLFQALEKEIVARRQIEFEYSKSEGKKRYGPVAPYKLLNLKGIWYLAALDGEKLKTFSVAKIENLKALETGFSWSKEIDDRLAAEEGIWFTENQYEVVLKINSEVAGYFKRRKLIANQVIDKELADGGLLLSAKIGHPNQVLPIIRYWIPHVRIISPETWQQDLESGLSDYLKRATE